MKLSTHTVTQTLVSAASRLVSTPVCERQNLAPSAGMAARRIHAMSLSVFLLLPALTSAASREIVELQRDVATLQDQVRALSSSATEKLTALTVLVQQTLDAANNANKAVAVLESRMNDRLKEQQASVGQPVAVVGAKVEQMSNDFLSM